jgi:homospermidine synthase
MKIINRFKLSRKLNKYLKERKQFDMIIPTDKFLDMKEKDIIMLCEWVQANNYINSKRTIIKMDFNTLNNIRKIFNVRDVMEHEKETVLDGYKIETDRTKNGFVVITTI